MDERSRPKQTPKFNLSVCIPTLVLVWLAGCSGIEPAPGTTTPDAARILPTLAMYPASDLSPTALSTPNPYLVTTTSNLWERLGANFGVNKDLSAPAPGAEPQDLWERLRAGFTLPDRQHPKARKEAQDYGGYQDHLDEVIERAKPYLYYVLEEIEKRGMPTEIALLPIVESAYQPLAYSSGGAAGIWQFIPSTGRNFGLKQTFWYDGRRDIAASTKAAMDYLQKLNIDFDGDWLLTLAAYNAGEGRVLRAMKKNRQAGKRTDFWSLDLPRETEAYIPRLLGVAALVADPDEYGANLTYVPDEPYLKSVEIESQIDLKVAAQMADITPQEIKLLNPGFTRGTSDPKGPHHLLLPISKVDIFNAKLATLDPGNLMPPKSAAKADAKTAGKKTSRKEKKPAKEAAAKLASVEKPDATAKAKNAPTTYLVRKGDSLSGIAQRFKISLAQLKAWNGGQLTEKDLTPGRDLKLYINPVPAVETPK
ncbi:MAG: transglycosylase SLT domain-containing protein [Gammaproteobacteria bacterium]